MNYKIFKLTFSTPVHFGKNSLEDSECSFAADLLFSALCHEAVNDSADKLSLLVSRVKDGEILFSDAFPYIKNTFLIPKPYVIVNNKDNAGDSVLKKAYKRLKYIPVDEIDSFLNGDFDVLNAVSINELGRSETKISVSLRGMEESMPYEVGYYTFNEDCGLYFVAAYSDAESLNLISELVNSLSFSGIGGKRHSGYGRFAVEILDVPSELHERLERLGNNYMSMSVSLPMECEMDSVVNDAHYSLVKRSGFVSSKSYANEQRRKKDIFMFAAGSCFANRYSGDVYDVSNSDGSHPVYRYAKPIFMEVSR